MRCNENGANETGKETDMIEVGHLLQEEDDEVNLDRHRGGDIKADPGLDRQLNLSKFQL